MLVSTETLSGAMLPVVSRGYLRRWSRALKDMGGSKEFYADATIERREFVLGDKRFPQIVANNPLRAKRHMLMDLHPPKELPAKHPLTYRLDCSCPLCRELGRGHLRSRGAGLPIVSKVSDSLRIIPNLYPSMKGHALLLSQDHDNLSHRVLPKKIGDEIVIPAERGKTRGNLLEVSTLEKIFSYCAQNGFWANRNHPLSGMSLPLHDHWHLHPQTALFVDYLADLDPRLLATRREKSYRIRNSPSDLLAITGEHSFSALALKTADIYNTLERQHIVPVIMFTPIQGGTVIFSTLDLSVKTQQYRTPIGGNVFLNRLSIQHCKGGIKAPSPYGTVDWKKLTNSIVTPQA